MNIPIHTMENHRSARVLTAALLGVMTIPVAAQNVLGSVIRNTEDYAIFRSLDDDGLNFHGEDIRQDVVEHQSSAFRLQHRAYFRAVERCRDLLREGEDVTCPDFNDPTTYDYNADEEPTHAAAQEEEVRSAPSSRERIRQLSTRERVLLRTYTRAGYCSTVLDDYLYDICRSIVGEDDTSMPMGIINDNVYLHSRYAAPRPSLKLRLQVLEESISGSLGRRTDLNLPLRYQGGLNQ